MVKKEFALNKICLLYTSDAADERSSVDLGGRRIIKKKNKDNIVSGLRRLQHSTRDRAHAKTKHITM